MSVYVCLCRVSLLNTKGECNIRTVDLRGKPSYIVAIHLFAIKIGSLIFLKETNIFKVPMPCPLIYYISF